MPDKKYKPFKRGNGTVDDSYKGRNTLNKVKFDQPLDDIAMRGSPLDLRYGDLYYALSYRGGGDYTSEDDWEDTNPNTKHQWWEVLEAQRMDDDYNYTSNDSKVCRVFAYVYPVDAFGNALTKAQIKKMPGGESYLRSIETRGYAKMTEWRGDPEDPIKNIPILRVPTRSVTDYYGNKELGRNISYKKEPDTSNWGGRNATVMYDTDDRGNRIPSEEGLSKWQAEHPGETYDPEFDSISGMPEDKAYKNAIIKFQGTKAERQAYAKRKAAEEDKENSLRAAHEKKFGTGDSTMYSCFSGFYKQFDDYQIAAGMSDEDIELLKGYVKDFGYHKGESPFKTKKELKNWVIEHHGDWEAAEEAIGNVSSQFAQARANAWGY